MPRRTSVFRQVDVVRALKAATAAGMHIERVELTNDKIVLVARSSTVEPSNDLDRWMAGKRQRES